jgi:hypothetical protein
MRLDAIAADQAPAGWLDTTWVNDVERSLPRPSDPCCVGRRLRSHRGPNRLCRRILVTHLLDLRSGELVTS